MEGNRTYQHVESGLAKTVSRIRSPGIGADARQSAGHIHNDLPFPLLYER